MSEKWKVDFSGVEDKSFDIPAGTYVAQVAKVTKEPGSGEYPYLMWDLKILSGKAKGLNIRYFTSLSPKSLFVLRGFLESLGLDVPKSAINLDPSKLIGLRCVIQVEDKPNKEGKMYPTVVKTSKATEGVRGTGEATPPKKGPTPPPTVDDADDILDLDEDDDDEPPFL